MKRILLSLAGIVALNGASFAATGTTTGQSEAGRQSGAADATGNAAGVDTSKNATAPGTGQWSPPEFLKTLHAINQSEIRVGQLAEKKGQSSAARKLGKTLVSDHRRNDQKLSAIAKKESVDLAATDDPKVREQMNEGQQTYQALEAATPADFDRELAQRMVDGHERAIELVRKAEADFAQDRRVHELATSTRPVLEKHRDMARNLLAQHGAGG